uniref:Membrane transporter protein n=1 Tax=Neobodo designis TaxID=312471 RepID=A0A7S1PNW8_NEODS
MDNAMIRSPGFTPAQAFADPPALPPELDEVDADDDSLTQLHKPGREVECQTSFGGPPRSGRQVTELDFGPDGHAHVKPRHYKSHDSSLSGRLLDFLGVPTHLSVSGMLVDLFRLFIPATATTILYFCNQAITMMFVGQTLGVEELAYYAVGISVFNIVGLSIGLGMATALDTLCSQAYGRDKKGPEVGILLQRGLVVCLSLASLVIVGFFFVTPLVSSVFGPKLGAGIALFLKSSPLYLVALICNFCVQKSLQAQQLAILPVWANVASAVACPAFNYWLTPHGVDHAAIAIGLSVCVAVVVMVVGALLHPHSIIFNCTWPTREAVDLRGAVEFMKVGVPGMFSVVAEWWAFELIIAFSARYGETTVTAFTICMNVLTFMFAFPSGLAVAAGVLCGNFLGANDPRGARSYARLALLVGGVLTLCVNLGLIFLGPKVFRLYTNDKHVLHLLNGVLSLLVVFHVGDASQSVMQGVFRGAGRQAMSARIVLVSLWLVGLPASWYLGESLEPLRGILTGLIVGFVVEIPLMAIDMLVRWDWEALAEAAAATKLEEQAAETQALNRGESDPANYGTV